MGSTLDLFLNPTQSLLLNQSLSRSTISQCTNRTPSNTLSLILSSTPSLLTNHTLSHILSPTPSLNTSSRSTSPIPSNTLNPILNLSLTIPMGPQHLHPSMSLFMNQLTLNQLITSRRISRSTQSQAPSHTTHLKNHTTHPSKSPTIHLSQNHTTLHPNNRLILNHRHTTPHRTSTTPTRSLAMDMRPRMEHLHLPLFMHIHHQLLHHRQHLHLQQTQR